MEQTAQEILNELAESFSPPQIGEKQYQIVCDAATGVCTAKLKVGVNRAYPVQRELLGAGFAHLRNKNVKVGDESGSYFGYGSVAKIDSIDRKNKTVTFVASTGSTDRMGDIIEQDGILLKNYRKNPVHLFAHDSRGLPIGIGPKIRVDGNKLIQQVKYVPTKGFDFPQVVFELIEAGVLRGISIGFLPIEFTFIEGGSGRRFTKIELLETSTVPIPANPEALVTGKSFSIGEALSSLNGNHELSKDDIWRELAAYADRTDPEAERAAAAIRRGDEKEIMPIIEAIVVELGCETMSTRAWLTAKLKQSGRGRIGALGDIVVRRRGSKMARSYAQALLHAIRCPECSRDQKNVWCTCGCRRRLCKRCEEVDQTTELILRELARSA